MVKITISKNNNSFRVRASLRGFGRVDKTFKDEKTAVQFSEEQRRLMIEKLEARRARATLGISEKNFTAKRITEALKSHVDNYLTVQNGSQYVEHNRYLINKLATFLIKREIVYCHEIMLSDLEDFQQDLLKNGLKASSVNRYFALYGGFFNRCMANKYIKENPMEFLNSLSVEENERPTWTVEQIKKVEDYLSGWHLDFFQFLYFTGCRPIEAANLTVSNIDFDRMIVRFTSRKGKRVNTRHFPLTSEAAEILRRNMKKGHEFIFVSKKGHKVKPYIFAQKLRRANEACGNPKGLVPYCLRHTFISDLVESDTSTLKIQALAGHKRSQTTEKYVHLSDNSTRSTVINLSERRRARIV